MGFFSFLSRSRKASKPSSKVRTRLSLEPLESRFLPTCYTISGFVFNDANNNGLFETGEGAIANAQLQLLNANNQVVNTATTDGTGYYSFQKDLTIQQTPQSTTQTLTFPGTATDFALQQALNQFNTSLGQLQSVVITETGSITSAIKVENTSPSPATINATVSGTMNLSGPGVSVPLNLQQNAGTFSASGYDGALDFGGASGISLAPQSAGGSAQITLTGSQLNAFEGTGTVTLTESANATSSASGGGNLVVSIASTGQATVNVTYNYIPGNCLKPGNYTIVLTQTPAGYSPGKESANGVVLNVTPGTNSIPVTLTASNLPNNDFGELLPSSLSGYVYVDNNTSGVKDQGDNGLPGVQIALSGTDWTGAAVAKTATTDPAGSYSFSNLQPGNYVLSEAQPAGYIMGKDNAGSQGGSGGNGQITGIVLAQNTQGLNNNFGELVPSGLSGYVYVDNNTNGVKDQGDNGLPGVQITLHGTDWTGAAVSQPASTDPTGFYSFTNLLPGNYALTEAQPAGYIMGTDNAGSQGGTAGNGQINGIALAQNIQGVNNNFGELVPKADVAVVKAAKQSQVQVGQEVDYTLTITNLGPNAAQNVLVTDNLPAGVTFLGATSASFAVTQNNGVITGTVNSLAVGAVAVITVSIDAPIAVGNITNTVTVTATTPDPNPNNNTSTVITPVISVPGKVFPKAIPPLVTTPAIVNKLQLIPGVTQYINQNVVNQMATIDGLFRTLEGRGATYNEQVTYSAQLQSGALSMNALVNQLWASPAHMNIEAASLYRQLLHRSPTRAELNSTVASLKAGAGETDVMLTLLTSAEYQAKHPDTASFINGFYADVLGQIPSSLTRLTLVQALGAQTLQQEAQALMSSQEVLNEIVTDGFDNIMRRPPTTAELQYWTNQLQGGVSQDAFLHQLLVSSQFKQLCVNRIQH
jgi:uncharacterized repeat protein (TIGR01451 family)